MATTAEQAIAKAKADWAKANASGDKAGMEAAHKAADVARGYETNTNGTAPKVATQSVATPTSPTANTSNKTVQTTNSPTLATTKPTAVSEPMSSAYASAFTGGGITGQGAKTIDNGYNPFAANIGTTGDFNDAANKNIDPIRELAIKHGVDLGTAKSMYEADIRNNIGGLGGEVYGTGNITDKQKSEYATAYDINKAKVDADPYLTSVVNSAQAAALGNQQPIVASIPNQPVPLNYVDAFKNDKLGQTLSNATSGDIFDPKAVYNMIINSFGDENKVRATMSYEEAMGMAGDKLDPLYKDSQSNYLDSWSKNARQRGTYGQLPTDALAATDLSRLENQKASDKATYAQSLMGQDKSDAMSEASLAATERNNKIQTLLSALQAAGQIDAANYKKYWDALTYNDNKAQQQLSNDMNMSQITGYFKGNPTIAYQQVLQNMDISKAELAEKISSNKQSLAQGWARINSDTAAAKEANAIAKQIGIDAKDQRSYDMDVTSKAYEMALSITPKDADGIVDVVSFEKNYRDALNRLTGNSSQVFTMPGTGIQSGTSVK